MMYLLSVSSLQISQTQTYDLNKWNTDVKKVPLRGHQDTDITDMSKAP